MCNKNSLTDVLGHKAVLVYKVYLVCLCCSRFIL